MGGRLSFAPGEQPPCWAKPTYTVQEGDKNLQAIARKFDTAAMLIMKPTILLPPYLNPER
jgi:hypothetical protein